MESTRLLSLAADLLAQHRHTGTGPVTGVSDGDTFCMVIDGEPTGMRLAQGRAILVGL